MTGVALSAATREVLSRPRWVYGTASHHSLVNGCPCCGSMHSGRHQPCPPAKCMLCGTVQCHSVHADCNVCLVGWLPGWSRMYQGGTRCGYAGCRKEAVATVRKKRMCTDHAMKAKYNGVPMAEHLTAAIAHRDSGKDWQRWAFTGPRVAW